MILCDWCGQAKECQQKEIDGREFDICADCWHPIEEKLKGKGRPKRRRDMVFSAAANGPGTRARRTKKAAWATEDFWQVELANWV